MRAQAAAIGERQAQEYIDSRREALALQQTWKAQQKMKDQRPEWDLNDPKMKNGVAARVGDNDPNLGPSSLQVFEGEDLQHSSRQAQLQAERKRFNEQQAQMKAEQARREAERERQESQMLAQATDYASQLAAEEYAARREQAYRTMQENKALARERKQRERHERQADDELSKLEAEVTLSHLNEEQRNSLARNGRVRKDAFKGMSRAQIAAIHEENARILADKEARRQAELQAKLRENQGMAEAFEMQQQAAAQDYVDVKRAEMRLAQENRLQRKLAKQTEAERNKAAKNNTVEATFFDRFGNNR